MWVYQRGRGTSEAQEKDVVLNEKHLLGKTAEGSGGCRGEGKKKRGGLIDFVI